VSLWFTVMINRHEVGSLVIRRLTNVDQAVLPGDAVSTYLVTRDGRKAGTVEHRYGDGAWALVRKALELQ